ncbi:hypothetical protein V6N12_065260 [Hibiscus sabdariffa]|uniref:Uncharacterized protein n=1 Tax=Hibiscus sabdariffa TaxID=183260 RepID=A0ABR2G8B1_9ROSI
MLWEMVVEAREVMRKLRGLRNEWNVRVLVFVKGCGFNDGGCSILGDGLVQDPSLAMAVMVVVVRARTIVGASPHLHVVVVEHVTMGAGVVDLRVLLKAST